MDSCVRAGYSVIPALASVRQRSCDLSGKHHNSCVGYFDGRSTHYVCLPNCDFVKDDTLCIFQV